MAVVVGEADRVLAFMFLLLKKVPVGQVEQMVMSAEDIGRKPENVTLTNDPLVMLGREYLERLGVEM